MILKVFALVISLAADIGLGLLVALMRAGEFG